MNLTKSHLTYWRERKGNPSWASTLSQHLKPTVTIDRIVNENAGIKLDVDAHSVIALLRLARKNKDLVPCMFACAYGPYRHQHVKRQHACARWLKKMGYTVKENIL